MFRSLMRKLVPSLSEVLVASSTFFLLEVLYFFIPIAHAQGNEAMAVAPPTTEKGWLVLLGWLLLTAIVNSVAHVMTSGEIDAWAEKNPRLAQLAAIMRRGGLEPIALIQAVIGFFAGNPPPPGIARAVGKTVVKSAGVLLLMLGISLSTSGCSAFFAPSANVKADVTTFETIASAADTIAVSTYSVAYPFLSPAQQAVAAADFAKGQGSYTDAINALNAGLAAYEAGATQNWVALEGDVITAIESVVALVDLYGSPLGSAKIALSTPAFVTQRTRLAAAVATLHRVH